MVARLLRLLLVVAILASTSSVEAYHTGRDRQTETSAFTLQKRQLRLGLFRQEYGASDSWMIGTYTAPWLLMPAAKTFNGNLYTKWKFLESKNAALALAPTAFVLGIRELNFQDLENAVISAQTLPISLVGSYIVNSDWTISLDAAWVQSFIQGSTESSSFESALGVGAQSNLQFALGVEYRLSRGVALNFVSRYVPLVIPARMNIETQVSSSTSANLRVNVNLDDVQHAWQVEAGMTVSGEVFNFRWGVGVGNFYVPGLRLVGPEQALMPNLDVYWRF